MKKPVNIYMDYAAATPVDAGVLSKMLPYFSDNFYNPSASYLSAKSVAEDVRSAREKIAKTLAIKPTEIVFTAGGTEANNLSIKGVMSRYPGKKLLISSIEHDSVFAVAANYDHQTIAVKGDGRINTDDLLQKIDDNTVLISIILASNEIGVIQPIAKIAKLLQAVKSDRLKRGNSLPLYLHTDASQAPLYLDLNCNRLGIDLLTLNGGKIYGPKQSGLLVVRTGIEITPLIDGGGQERGLRSGTENVPAIIGLSEALYKAQRKHKQTSKDISELRDYFIRELTKLIPDIEINGSLKHRLANNISIVLPGKDNERLMMELDELGVKCAVGSACSASSDEPSKVLKAIGLSDSQAQSSLRFSLGNTSDKQQIDYVVSGLKTILAKSYI